MGAESQGDALSAAPLGPKLGGSKVPSSFHPVRVGLCWNAMLFKVSE